MKCIVNYGIDIINKMNTKEYILEKILNTEVQTNPWKHMIIDNFLPKDLFDGIKKETKKYQTIMGNHNIQRGYVTTINKSVDFYPDFNNTPCLYEYYQILTDKDIELAIKKQVNIKDYHSNNLSKDMWSSFDIQEAGFVYDVHSDIEEKIHTLVHYLADLEDDDTLGTTLYSPYIESSKLNTQNDYLKRAKYIPNSAILFSPCEKMNFITNHSMFHTSKKTRFRKTLQTFWLKKESDWTNLEWSAEDLTKV